MMTAMKEKPKKVTSFPLKISNWNEFKKDHKRFDFGFKRMRVHNVQSRSWLW